MRKTSYLCIGLAFLVFSVPSRAQDKPSGIDRYMQTGKTIFIAKCIKVGPVNILLRTVVDLEVIFVVKGARLPSKISVVSQFGMEPGKTYLLRSENDFTTEERRLSLTTPESVILIQEYEDLAELISLPLRAIVLRTMNQRVNHLEYQIMRLTNELEALKAARK